MEQDIFSSASRQALITIDSLLLVVPQNEIITLEPVEDIDQSIVQGRSVGSLKIETGVIPVFNLDRHLCLTGLEVDRRIVVALANDGSNFAILADELSIIEADLITWNLLPKAVRSEHSPVSQVGILEERLVCLTRARDIHHKLIGSQGDTRAA